MKLSIPDWYNPDYKTAELLPCQWLEQFYIRYCIKHAQDFGTHHAETIEKYIEATRVQGVVTVQDGHSSCRSRKSGINKGLHHNRVFGTRSIQQYDPEKRLAMQNNAEIIGADTNQDLANIQAVSAYTDELYNEGVVTLEIDTFASDAQLKKDFDKWLSSHRKKVADITSAKIASWHKNKVLPYMDLMLWERAQDGRLEHDVLLSALSIDSRSKSPTEKTLPCMMAEILTLEYLQCLNLKVRESGEYGIYYM